MRHIALRQTPGLWEGREWGQIREAVHQLVLTEAG